MVNNSFTPLVFCIWKLSASNFGLLPHNRWVDALQCQPFRRKWRFWTLPIVVKPIRINIKNIVMYTLVQILQCYPHNAIIYIISCYKKSLWTMIYVMPKMKQISIMKLKKFSVYAGFKVIWLVKVTLCPECLAQLGSPWNRRRRIIFSCVKMWSPVCIADRGLC